MAQQLELPRVLHPRPDEGNISRVGAGERGGGSERGQVARIHDRQQRAGLQVEELNEAADRRALAWELGVNLDRVGRNVAEQAGEEDSRRRGALGKARAGASRRYGRAEGRDEPLPDRV